MRRTAVLVVLVVMVAGCDLYIDGDDDSWGSEPVPRQKELEATNESVKELVACGGMQFAAMRGLAGSVVSEAGYPDIAELLFGRVDMEREGDAYVTLLPGGVFTMRFARAGVGIPLELDVFSFATYVADPVLETPESIEAWQNGDIDFALHFSGPGPLFDMLDGGRGLQSPIRFQIETEDVYALSWNNELRGDLREVFGPLLGSLCIESELDFEDHRYGVDVSYRMTTPQATILDLLDGGSLKMNIEYLEARSSTKIVRPVKVDVSYVEAPLRGLAGVIGYAVYDIDDDSVMLCTAIADYGDGAVYGVLEDDCD